MASFSELPIAVRDRAIAAATNAIVLIDGNPGQGHIVYVNPAFERLTGYSVDEAIGQSLMLLKHPETDLATLRELITAIREGRETEVTLQGRRKDGSAMWNDVTLAPVRDEEGTITHFVHIFNDATARKELERQTLALARSEKMRALGQMASGIAHDLNQSLQLIAAHNELARQQLEQATPDLDEVRELCTVAAQAALDAGEAVKRLLLFTRGAPDDTPQRVDLVTIAGEVARLTAPRWRDLAQAQGRAIELRLELRDRPVVLAPAAPLRDALTNLLFNAIDALPHGGAIRLRVEQRDGLAWIEVADTGVGMPPEVQARVFEPFFTTKGEGGTGLGLAIVFGVVERCGGRITIDSTPGQGTTIRLSLPLAPELPQTAPPPPCPDDARAGGPALRVLAVDDEPAITRAVQRILRPAGHLVRCAASGEQALEELATAPVDVVVSDLGMGTGMTGWDLAARVRADWPAVRFILATGWGAGISQAEAEAKGVERVLAKPYRPDDLLQALAAPVS